MKNLISICVLAFFCACAQNQSLNDNNLTKRPSKEQAMKQISQIDALAPDGANLHEVVKNQGFLKPIDAAKWCFNALVSGDGEGFYNRCSLKGSSTLAQLRKSRWERMANEAALKIDDKGGLLSVNIDCKHNESKDRAVCQIVYQLAKVPNPLNTLMPLQFEPDSGWLIVR